MADRALELGNEGKSLTQIAHELGISRAALYRYAETYDEFRDAIDRAQAAAQSKLEDRFLDFALGIEKGNAQAFIHLMRCRFPQHWNAINQSETKTEVTHTNNVEEIRQKISAIAKNSAEPALIDVSTQPPSITNTKGITKVKSKD